MARLARYSYGLCYLVPFDELEGHLQKDRILDVTGEWLAKSQMGWMIKKGDRMEDGRVMSKQLITSV
jgi:hypothetical protein